MPSIEGSATEEGNLVPEATLVETESGLQPDGEGWFVVNARDTAWERTEELGTYCTFEGPAARFAEFGIGLHVVQPGQPNAMYHGEANQEDFLVLSGECLVLIEGEERRLGPWDFVHCPPWTEHIFVGAGDGPCVILMAGGRRERGLRYPVSELALRHGAGVEEETTEGDEAYARFSPPRPGRPEGRFPWDD
jgi:uncharacterized cupin superfamily protein